MVKESHATTVSWQKASSGSGCRHTTTSPTISGTLDLSLLSARTQLSGTTFFFLPFLDEHAAEDFWTFIFFQDIVESVIRKGFSCFVFFLKCSYAEVRAEQRRELGIEEANPEVTADKVRNKPHKCTVTVIKNMSSRGVKLFSRKPTLS